MTSPCNHPTFSVRYDGSKIICSECKQVIGWTYKSRERKERNVNAAASDTVTKNELRGRLGVTSKKLSLMIRDQLVPRPDDLLNGKPAWRRATISTWYRACFLPWR